MMDFVAQFSLFALETFTIVIAILLAVAGVASIRQTPKSKLTITPLNKDFDELKSLMHKEILGKRLKKTKKNKQQKPSLYVLHFIGDMKATQVEQLREEISAILTLATPQDEVVLCLESPGGSVNGYGLAASQLQRLRDKHIPLTICIDKIAASGGYLMACLGHQIIAAPFAIIGSIGVVAQMPNFHRWLKKNDIDVELLTAGEYKRTLTLFAENTEKGRNKFKQDLEQIHLNFKQYVLENREQLNIDDVSTGEHWLAKEAINLRLIDKLQTSDEYIIDKMSAFNVFKISIHAKQTIIAKILKPAMALLHPWA